MNVKIYPHLLSGNIMIPGSKSLTHRALICASLSAGESIIYNPLLSDDTLATINCLKALGVKIVIDKSYIKVKGVNSYIIDKELDVGESASTLRFLIPLISIWNNHFFIKVAPRLLERIKTKDLQTLIGLDFYFHDNNIEVVGTLNKDLQLTDEITTQWISGVLFTLPFTKGSIKVNKLDNQYINMTLLMMKKFNVYIKENNNTLIYNEGRYFSNKIIIEGDLSNAAFFLTSAIFNNIKVKGINLDSIQGDVAIFNFFNQMGLSWKIDNEGIWFNKDKPQASNFDLSLNPDLAPIIAALASLSRGISILTGLEKLQYKESNRLESTYQSLKTLGANINIDNNNLVIEGREFLNGGVTINSYNDHRIIMSLVAISSKVKKPFIITDCQAISKSNPDFFNQFQQVGGICEYQI